MITASQTSLSLSSKLQMLCHLNTIFSLSSFNSVNVWFEAESLKAYIS